MSAPIEVTAVTDPAGKLVSADILASAEAVHRQLRPQLPADYARRMGEVFAGGARMAVARVGGKVVGVAVWRILEKTFTGRELYCDDLVTDETQRSTGVGHALMAHMQSAAQDAKCDVFALDSGCQRQQAHKFYFREGMTIAAFRFSKQA